MFLCSIVESNEYTELDIDDILHDIDHEEEVNRKIQEQKDAVITFLFYLFLPLVLGCYILYHIYNMCLQYLQYLQSERLTSVIFSARSYLQS